MFFTSQVVQDFFYQQYSLIFPNRNMLKLWKVLKEQQTSCDFPGVVCCVFFRLFVEVMKRLEETDVEEPVLEPLSVYH